MISAEESRKIAAQVKLEADPTYQKTQSLFEKFSKFIADAAKSGDTRYVIRLPKPDYRATILMSDSDMDSPEIFDIFQKHVAPKLRDLGYIVETDVDFSDYEIMIKW